MKVVPLFLMLLLPVSLQAYAPQLDVLCYRAELTFEIEEKALTATADILLTNSSETEMHCIPLDLVGLSVLSVAVDNTPVPWVHDFGGLLVYPEDPVRKGDTISVHVVYGGIPLCSNGCGPVFGEVSYCIPQSGLLDYLCTTTHWLPINNCFADKARWDLTFNVREGLCAASIGTLQDCATAEGRSRYRWVEDIPTAPHCVTYAVADYACVRDTILGIPAAYYVLQKDESRAAPYFAPIADMVDMLTMMLGPWPADKIGFCWVPFGAVEGQGMITFDVQDWDLTAGVVEAHELAHHWFGNGITPADVNENWLSEGFATYFEWLYRVQRYDEGGMDALASRFVTSYREQIAGHDGALPLQGYRDCIDNNYPGTIYFKGALVLNMLRHVMGDAAFYAGLRHYVQSYMGGTATSVMFRGAMEESSGQQLGQFFSQWVYDGGWPVFELRRFCEDPDGAFRICVRQTQQDRGWPLFATPVELDLVLKSGDTMRVTRQLPAVEQCVLTVDSLPDMEVVDWIFDPDGWLLSEIASVTGVREIPGLARAMTVEPIYPQPLGGSRLRGLLPITLPRPASVRAELRDMLGRRVAVLTDAHYFAGRHEIGINCAELPRGCYHVLLHAGDDIRTVPVVVN